MKISADEFNERHPVGTPVTYYPVLPEAKGVLPLITHTRTPAWEPLPGRPLVSVDGRAGGMALTHIEIRPGPVLTSAPPKITTTADVDTLLDKITAAREEAESIRCPHCQHVQTWDAAEMAEMGLVTYHGDEGATLVGCDYCDKDFWVRENMERTYDAAKTEGELE